MTFVFTKRIALILFAVAAATGCKDSGTTGTSGGQPAAGDYSRLVGIWEGSEKPTMTVDGKKVDVKGDPLVFTFEFRDDGTMTMNIPIFPQPVTGTWKGTKSEGNKITIETVMNMPSFKFEGKFEGGKESSKEEVGVKKETKTITVTFEKPDQIVMAPTSDPADQMTLKRKK